MVRSHIYRAFCTSRELSISRALCASLHYTMATVRRCRLPKDYHVLLFVAVFYMNLSSISSQTYRPFPSLYNVAKYKTIYTDPSDSTCGVPFRSAYCRSTPSATSLDECRQDYCVQECPRRTSLPRLSNLLRASNYGSCVTTDTDNRRPGSAADGFSAVFTSGASCYIHPLDRLALGANGAFTLTFWLWQRVGNIG
jgi:hypothetical protein